MSGKEHCSVERLTWPGPAPRGMMVTDLDGTLRLSQGGFLQRDLDALELLRKNRVVRAIATGRSLYSYLRSVPTDFPVDYVIFSSGAGVIETADWTLVKKEGLEPDQVAKAAGLIREYGLDYMIHAPVPDNHVFYYDSVTGGIPDFIRRIGLYRDCSFPLAEAPESIGCSAQLVAMAYGDNGVSVYEKIKEQLNGFTVIRTTSPLDGQTIWIEIFPPHVSKSLTAKWLAGELGVHERHTLSIGNDYNDLDLLEWAATSYVVGNAPEDLKKRFRSVASNDTGGVAEAVDSWLGRPDGIAGA